MQRIRRRRIGSVQGTKERPRSVQGESKFSLESTRSGPTDVDTTNSFVSVRRRPATIGRQAS